MKSVYRGSVRLPLQSTSLLSIKSHILYFPKLTSGSFEWEALTGMQTGFFKTRDARYTARRCCSTGKQSSCFINEGNRFTKDWLRYKNKKKTVILVITVKDL